MEKESDAIHQLSRFRRICVFCGSSHGKKTSYQDAAIELGGELVSRNIDLVYGGGSIGLMGLVSQAVHDGGRHVIGVIPKTLMPRELTGETVGEVKAVADMHQRKAEMAKHSDAFIALPGGYGTLEELLEVITWAQLGIHNKPVGLLNVDGYYNSLLSFIDKAVEEGFISPSARQIIVSAPTAKELVKQLEVVDVYVRVTGGEVGASSSLAPKIGPLGLSPKKIGEDIAKETGIGSVSAKRTKDIKHSGNISLDDVTEIARVIRPRSMAKDLSGTVKEILGTCVSVGCTVDGKDPKDLQQEITDGDGDVEVPTDLDRGFRKFHYRMPSPESPSLLRRSCFTNQVVENPPIAKDMEAGAELQAKDYHDPSPAPMVDVEELAKWSLYRAIIAEFTTTLIFLYITALTVIGYKIQAEVSKDNCSGVGTLGIARAHKSCSDIWAVSGLEGVSRAVMYIVAQCLGAICGFGLVKAFEKDYYTRSGGGANILADVYTKGTGLAAEIIGTFVLLHTVFSATDPKRNARDSHVPLWSRCYILVLAPLRLSEPLLYTAKTRRETTIGCFGLAPSSVQPLQHCTTNTFLRAAAAKAIGSFRNSSSAFLRRCGEPSEGYSEGHDRSAIGI
ncbi:hypothetical protein SAY87_024048 [Trapa incisa]|uniref:cytokinin riboside 5'-monophosphate phosphoribohydrolase n=1 Tax=Trapa incisa TaxID=236973 RepID=A0AAN7QRV3_9MYRT|nr:hypothetical protein SAY87_024048 [Trapa incisa]